MSDVELDLIGAAIADPRITASVKVQEQDFLHPSRGMAWVILGEMHEEGTAPDPLLIANRASARGIRIDPQLIVDAVGAGLPANAGHYADMIRDAAHRRRLSDALTRARQQLDSDADLPRIVSDLSKCLDVSEETENVIETAVTLDELADTPIPADDWVIPGLMARGDRVIITGAEGWGKALALDTPIPTPTGWTTMGDLAVGDSVLGADGKPCRVTFATDVQTNRTCYRMTFSDGSQIVADAEHRWLTYSLKAREAEAKNRKRGPTKPRGTDQRHKMARPEVVTTEQIRATLTARGGHCLNHAIPTTAPIELPDAKLLIDPYVLGAWLGDGTSTAAEITTHPDDEQIIDRIRSAGYTVERKLSTPYQWNIHRRPERALALARVEADVAAGMARRAAERTNGVGRRNGSVNPILSLREELRLVGVFGAKHIPTEYLRASAAQRLSLLQGLMDTDGTISPSGDCEFTVTNKTLADGVMELLVTLGMKPTVYESAAKLRGVEVGRRWRIRFTPTLNPFHLARKRARYIEPRTARGALRYITAVDPVASVPVRCIQVDNADRLYLAGREMIPTHNTTLIRQLAVCAAAGLHPFAFADASPQRVLMVDAENPLGIMVRRMGALRNEMARRGKPTKDRFWVSRQPQGMDLSRPGDRLKLHALCRMFRPDLLVIGPAYKLYVGGAQSREEDLARQVTSTLDGLREEFGLALILEHHSPHGMPGQKRTVRPIGSTLWQRWPEFGFGLAASDRSTRDHRVAVVQHWRGMREDRPWPRELEQGQSLPWVDADPADTLARSA